VYAGLVGPPSVARASEADQARVGISLLDQEHQRLDPAPRGDRGELDRASAEGAQRQGAEV